MPAVLHIELAKYCDKKRSARGAFDLDKYKIANWLFRQLIENENDAALCKKLIRLAHLLNEQMEKNKKQYVAFNQWSETYSYEEVVQLTKNNEEITRRLAQGNLGITKTQMASSKLSRILCVLDKCFPEIESKVEVLSKNNFAIIHARGITAPILDLPKTVMQHSLFRFTDKPLLSRFASTATKAKDLASSSLDVRRFLKHVAQNKEADAKNMLLEKSNLLLNALQDSVAMKADVDTVMLTKFVETIAKEKQSPYQDLLAQLKLQKLLQHVARGEQAEAETLLKDNIAILSFLLGTTGIVTTYAKGLKEHVVVEGTAYRIALGAEDVKFQEDEECMVEMLARYIKMLPESEALLDKQYQDQFPVGYEQEKKEKNEKDITALRAVIQAIANADPNDDCEAAFTVFRNYLEPKCPIKYGKHFNAELLAEAFRLYDKNYKSFGNSMDNAKNILCCRKVIGYIQRFLPACYAQAFCGGFYDIAKVGHKLRRSLEFSCQRNDFFFPLDSDSSSRCGYDWAIGRLGGMGVLSGRPGAEETNCGEPPSWFPDSVNFFIKIKPPCGGAKDYEYLCLEKYRRCKAYATSRRSMEAHSFDHVEFHRNP